MRPFEAHADGGIVLMPTAARVRKQRVLDLAREGYSRKEIAHRTGTPIGTVNFWCSVEGVRWREPGPAPRPPNAAPAPYARGFRWFSTKWA